MRKFFSALLAASLLAGPAFADAPSAAPGATPAPGTIDGFRSARFGMSQTDVRHAIETDFNLPASAIAAGENSLQRTATLTVVAPDLVAGAGKAVVNYVFGYKCACLVQVTLAWSRAVDSANSAKALIDTGALLTSYFEGENFPPGKSAAGAVLPNGALLLFRGTDDAGHAVVMILSGPLAKTGKAHQIQMTPALLSVAYAANPAHPDVYALPPGAF